MVEFKKGDRVIINSKHFDRFHGKEGEVVCRVQRYGVWGYEILLDGRISMWPEKMLIPVEANLEVIDG